MIFENQKNAPDTIKSSFMPLGLVSEEKVQKCNFLLLKWLPFPKVKVIWGHIPGQGAPYLKQMSMQSFIGITKIDWELKCKNMTFSIENGGYKPIRHI